ncbi:MAG: MerR family transcriptional regulator [Candidatus Omnitrophica bacterium]|nr:MerR family transcriptional regulator [Candidatus Omnitrophota bacterium]MCM8826679.1 MerR family transcriptional regulator [Candidatus Omnitrophota bacterium]
MKGQINNLITITDLAEQIGVVPKTIIRWEKAGKIKKAKRDWKNWRVYTSDDVMEIKKIVQRLY